MTGGTQPGAQSPAPRAARAAAAFVVAALLLGGLAELWRPDFNEKLSYAYYDALYLCVRRPPPWDERLALVLVDDDSLARLGEWPLPRRTHADLLRRLAAAGAAQAVFDVLFEQPTPDDDELAAAMRALPSLLAFACHLPQNAPLVPPSPGRDPAPELLSGLCLPSATGEPAFPPARLGFLPTATVFAAARDAGHINLFPDADGIVRRLPLFLRHGDTLLPSLALQAALARLQVPLGDVRPVRGGLELGGRTLPRPRFVPLDRDGCLLLNGVADWRGAVSRRSYGALLATLRDFPDDARPLVADRTVIVGIAYTGGGDTINLPGEPEVPGVLVILQAANALLTGQLLTPAGLAPRVALLTLALLALGLAFITCRGWRFFAVAAGVLGLLAVLPAVAFRAWGYYLPAGLPLLAGAGVTVGLGLYAYHLAQQRTRRAANLLRRFVSPALLDALDFAAEEEIRNLVARRELTVLFSDMAGFTAFSDSAAPEEVSQVLARYYELAARAVAAHGGQVDKFLGDGVLAYWATDPALPPREQRAVAAAQQVQREFAALHRELGRRLGRPLQVRCGLTTGFVTLGYLGGDTHASYTIIGRVVNLAARLQGAAEPGTTVCDQATAAGLPETAVRFLRQESLKGFDQPVALYLVLPPPDATRPDPAPPPPPAAK